MTMKQAARPERATKKAAGPSVVKATPRVRTAKHRKETTASAQHVDVRERISQLAYSYWLARGCQGGDPSTDWFRAEEELMPDLRRG